MRGMILKFKFDASLLSYVKAENIVFASQSGKGVKSTPQRDNRQPVAGGVIAAQSLTVGGATAMADVSGGFSDPDGYALSLSPVSRVTSKGTGDRSMPNSFKYKHLSWDRR